MGRTAQAITDRLTGGKRSAKRGTTRNRKKPVRPPAPKVRAGKAGSPRPRRQFMSPEIAAGVRKRLLQIAGLALLVVATLLAAALVTYHPSDPSMNSATGAPPRNLLGHTGAWVSDLMLQQLGLAAALIVIVLLVWSIRLLRGEPLHAILWRLLLLPAALIFAVIALEAMAPGADWPVAGAGGVVGSLLFGAAQQISDSTQAGLGPLIIAVIAAVATILLLLPVLGLSWSEWRGVGARLRRPVAAIAGRRRAARGESRKAARQEASTTSRQAGTESPAAPAPEPAAAPPAAGGVEAANDGALPLAEAELPPAAADEAPTTAEKPRKSRKRPRKGKPEVTVTRGRRATPPPEPEALETPPGQRKAKVSPRADAADAAGGGAGRVTAAKKTAPSRKAASARQRRLDLKTGDFAMPALDLLQLPTSGQGAALPAEALEENARILEGVLADFGIKGNILKVRPGPVVTLYELEPEAGVRASRVINLSDDIARSMSAVSARVAVVPGRNVIGIELPNQTREMVYLRDLLASRAYEASKAALPLTLGKDIGGAPVIADLAKMPHLLIAGTTGSGKSVGINAMILSLLYKLTPEQCKLIMIDPKMLELSVYDDIPHLLTPVVTEPKKAVVALRWAVREMETRYQAMSKLGVRNIDGFNQRLADAQKKGEVLTEKVAGEPGPDGRPVIEERAMDLSPIPYIVVIVDEMADLMLVAGKDIEAAVQRLAQMARAAGIHLIMATQRPSVDVITGTIKANFPTRISFQVTSKIDSRTILGEQGSESLLGQGDMLFMAGGGRISRVHGPFVSDDEVEQVASWLRQQGEPKYIEEVTREEDNQEVFGLPGGEEDGSDADLYRQAVEIVINEGKCSISFIQRKLQIGYNRAARLVERMEDENIISEADHRGKREVLANTA